jgi:Winged helix DNA-binding domain
MLAGDVRKMQKFEPGKSVCLLPGFDQYVVAASYHAEKLMPMGLRSRVYRQQGWISPVLLVNGFMQGTWRHTIQNKSKKSQVVVMIEPFAKLPVWVRTAAKREAERLAVFLGCELSGVKFDS